MKSITPAARRWTRQEYEKSVEAGILTPEDKVELLNGDTIELSPQTSMHRTGVLLVADAVHRIFARECFVQVQMPIVAGDLSEPEPDVAVIAGDPRDCVDEHPSRALLIVEVADTSLEYDRTTKASVYAQVSIEDYWVVNLVDECVEVCREPIPMANQPSGYGYRSRMSYTRGEKVAPLAASESTITVDELLP